MLPGALFSKREYRTLRYGIAASVIAHILLISAIGARPGWHTAPSTNALTVTLQDVSEATPATRPDTTAPAADIHSGTASRESGLADTAQAPGAAGGPVELNLTVNKYFSARELDVRAEQLNEVTLVYPVKAYQQRLAGKVILRLYVSDRGELDRIDLVEASPPGIFEEAALEAARSLRFRPAMLNGHTVRSLKVIEVFFDPYEKINVP